VAIGNNLIYVSNYYGGSVTAYSQTASPPAQWSASGLGTTGDVVVSGTNLFVVHNSTGNDNGFEISEYNALTGASETPALVPNLYDTFGLAVSGTDLFVSSYAGGTVGEYTIAGAIVNASLVTGLPDGTSGLTISGTTIYVADGSGVAMYNVSTGTLIGTITAGLEQANSVAVIPEPSTWALLATGSVGLVIFALRRRSQSVD
jgi:hypothetical protein